MKLEALSQCRLVYLATPYTKYPKGPVAAFVQASVLAGQAMQAGVRVFCPIAHGHPLSWYGGVPMFDQEMWKRQDAAFVKVSSALLVGKLDGWRESEGVQHEINEFAEACKPIYYIDPDTLEVDQ